MRTREGENHGESKVNRLIETENWFERKEKIIKERENTEIKKQIEKENWLERKRKPLIERETTEINR